MRGAHLDIRGGEIIVLQLVGSRSGRDRVHADRLRGIADEDAAFLLAELVHQHQHIFLALQGQVTIGVNIVNRRRLGQTGQE